VAGVFGLPAGRASRRRRCVRGRRARRRPGMRRKSRADSSVPVDGETLIAARGQGRLAVTTAAALKAGFTAKAA